LLARFLRITDTVVPFYLINRRTAFKPFANQLPGGTLMIFRRLLVTLALVLVAAGTAYADLDTYLHSLNVYAEGDIGGFRAQLGAHFGASGPQVDLVFRSVDDSADAAVCFWLARQIDQPVEVVVREYNHHRGQGWGVLAKSLGIKPGSAAFKDLK
jgi:hypothetical protein